MRTLLSLVIVLFTAQVLQAQWQGVNPIYYNGGNVGIGTNAPVYRLHVLETTSAVAGLFERSFTTNNTYAAALVLKQSTSATLANGFGPALTFQVSGSSGVSNNLANIGAVRTGADNSGSLIFNTLNAGVGSEKMRITNTGNVGIGNANPAYLLDIVRNINDATPSLNIRNSNAGASAQASINFFNNAGTTFATHGAMLSFTSSVTANPNTVQLWNFMNGSIRIGTNNAERMRISPNGNVGIGASAPSAKLDVQGNNIRIGSDFSGNPGTRTNNTLKAGEVTVSHFNNAEEDLVLVRGITNSSTNSIHIGGGTGLFNAATDIIFWTGSTNASTTGIERMRIDANGNVAIGTTNLPAADAKLAVKGIIYSQKVKVTQTGWADYVFDPGYRLRSLAEVEQYIQRHRHLPEVPTAAEVEKNGLDLGGNQATLLKKIEELTLYIIKQQREIEKLKEHETLHQRLTKLYSRIEQLESKIQTLETR